MSLSSFSIFVCAVHGDTGATRPDEIIDSFQPDSPTGQHQARLSTACLSFPRVLESRQLLRHTRVPIDLHLHPAILQDPNNRNQRRLKEEEKQVLGSLAIFSGCFRLGEREHMQSPRRGDGPVALDSGMVKVTLGFSSRARAFIPSASPTCKMSNHSALDPGSFSSGRPGRDWPGASPTPASPTLDITSSPQPYDDPCVPPAAHGSHTLST